jgi:hypothetical protein
MAVSATLAVSLLDPLITYYNQLYFVVAGLLTAGAMAALQWKWVKRKRVDYGKYPLRIAQKKGRGFPTSALHENVHNAASRIMPNQFQSSSFSMRKANFIRHKTQELVAA